MDEEMYRQYVRAEEHRELARQQLMLLLKAGYSPLRFYVHDISKYFYLGELLALVDLSLVSLMPCPSACGSSEMLSTMLMCLNISISTNVGIPCRLSRWECSTAYGVEAS